MGGAGLLALCRAGFEKECAQELSAFAAGQEVEGYVRAKPGAAWLTFHPHEPKAGERLARRVPAADLVFPRQVAACGPLLADLPVGDRARPIAEAAAGLGTRFHALFLETPDTNEGKALASLLRPLEPHLRRALACAGVECEAQEAAQRLHVFFPGSTACHVAVSPVAGGSPWPMGIPRLRMPRGAPSRSTLKLAEAIAVLVGEGAAGRLRPGMTAVDLGASPGGWTWQLVHRGLHVTAVDNGPMDESLLETGQVRHRREDGFRFRPPEPVDWMVCDMVESPSRVCALAARWVAEGWCGEAIFNLKLPMKKRWEEVQRARGIVAEAFAGRAHALRLRQLYHDREEVTAWLAPGRAPRA